MASLVDLPSIGRLAHVAAMPSISPLAAPEYADGKEEGSERVPSAELFESSEEEGVEARGRAEGSEAATPRAEVIGWDGLRVIFGPMFSGKTSGLLAEVEALSRRGVEVVVVKYARDTRYASAGVLSTHDRIFRDAVAATVLSDVPEELLGEAEVVAIDEAQFFPDVIAFCEAQLAAGRHVLCAGLDATFERKPFGPMADLIARAASLAPRTAVCVRCGAQARHTRRLVDSSQLELIGGAELYVAACHSCFNAPAVELSRPPPADKLARWREERISAGWIPSSPIVAALAATPTKRRTTTTTSSSSAHAASPPNPETPLLPSRAADTDSPSKPSSSAATFSPALSVHEQFE